MGEKFDANNQESPSAVAPASERIARMAIIGILGGIPAGLVGGLSGRLIMRVFALVNDESAGVMTENGNIAGEITASGTLGLIISIGLVSGVIGGFVYVMIRRWLPGGRLLKGVVFGLVLLCFSGTIREPLTPLFDPDNVDFALFGPRLLAVGLFALLFPLYGVVASFVIERYDQYVPPLFTRSPITVLGYLLIVGLCAFGLSHTAVAINSIL